MYTLQSLLTSKTRIKILSLFLFTNKKYHLREISRRVKITPIYVSKELKNLENIDLIKKEKLANLSIYSINENNRIIDELRSIFRKCK